MLSEGRMAKLHAHHKTLPLLLSACPILTHPNYLQLNQTYDLAILIANMRNCAAAQVEQLKLTIPSSCIVYDLSGSWLIVLYGPGNELSANYAESTCWV